jgi:hypothetical protein
VLVYEQDVVLEAGVEVGFKPKVDDDRIVVAVDVGIDTIQPLEHLLKKRSEAARERDT